MAKVFEAISAELQAWLQAQRIFFVASAPLAAEGLVNCSPKGMDSFRVLGPRQVAYLDLTGSGIETVAHVRENQRIVFLFCAFDGPPKIVRLHGLAQVLTPASADWSALRAQFPPHPGARAIVRANLTRISDSCGYAVPRMDFVAERDTLLRSSEAKGEEGLRRQHAEKNSKSLDGLAGLPRE